MTNFSGMTKEEAIMYCYQNEDAFINRFKDKTEGIRKFGELINGLDFDEIKPSELSSYGMV